MKQRAPLPQLFALLILFLSGCKKPALLQQVTTEDFKNFVEETSYVTDAEKFGWSIVQQNVFNYITVDGATWRKPDGTHQAHPKSPVTQVSYNDALAYCQWAGLKLPSYDQYWKLAKRDDRKIHIDANYVMFAEKVNVVGNTWDITTSFNRENEVRLAGGSYLCSKFTCDGTNKARKLYVSKDTGNLNISFSVVNE